MDNKTNGVSVGSVVRSVTGRDRKRVFLVVGEVGNGSSRRLLVADGSLRSVLTPKRKNPSHVVSIGMIGANEAEVLSHPDDEAVRQLIRRYDDMTKNCDGGVRR